MVVGVDVAADEDFAIDDIVAANIVGVDFVVVVGILDVVVAGL